MKTETNKILGLLGMAKRAGFIIQGFDAAVKATADKKAVLVLAAEDVSEKTKKEWKFETKNFPLTALPFTKEILGQALGSAKPIGLIALCDDGFAGAVLKQLPVEKI